MVEIVDDIGRIVQAMREGGSYDVQYAGEYAHATGAPFYLYGHRITISNRLSELDDRPKGQNRKYPLIALNGDLMGTPRNGVVDFNINVLIANNTDINWDEEDRQAKNFIKILEPLYESFMDKFVNYGNGFMWEGDLTIPEHNVFRRAFKSSSDDGKYNIFNDPIDAIEIIGLKFSKQKMNC